MRNLLAVLLLVVSLPLMAQGVAPENLPGSRPWSEVESIVAEATLRFEDYGSQKYHLTADGRVALIMEPTEEQIAAVFGEDKSFDPESMPATVGTYALKGSWIELSLDATAFRSEAIRSRVIGELMKHWEAKDEAALEAKLATMREEFTVPPIRALRVPYRSGELWLPEAQLVTIAKYWDGRGPLAVIAMAWRVPEDELPEADENGMRTFKIANPLSAGLPIELTGLLRRDAIEGRIVEVLDTAESLEWKYQHAKVRLRIDRGANHGMYKDMDLYGLPPDEGFFARVVELDGETAIAEKSVSRFSPKHAPEMPSVGLRFSTRRDKALGCAIDTSAPVRAKVIAIAQSKAQVEWDEEGFAWIEATVDQGRRHGLIVGDTFSAEIDDVDGEGLVTAVQDERASVLWRVHRYDEEQDVRLPVAGEALVTPAWQREARDAFDDETTD